MGWRERGRVACTLPVGARRHTECGRRNRDRQRLIVEEVARSWRRGDAGKQVGRRRVTRRECTAGAIPAEQSVYQVVVSTLKPELSNGYNKPNELTQPTDREPPACAESRRGVDELRGPIVRACRLGSSRPPISRTNALA